MKLHVRPFVIAALSVLSVFAFAENRNEVRKWQISFELAFGEGAPYLQQFKPNLYEVSYATSHHITAAVLPEIARKARIMSGVKLVSLYFGPGGYEKYVNPSAQMIVQGTPGQARLACSIIGYLAQQTEVIASSDDPHGNVQTYDIPGFRATGFDRVTEVRQRWTKLNSLSGKLVGFLPRRGAMGGIRILNLGDRWSPEDYRSFQPSTATAFGTKGRSGFARLLSSKNDWKANPSGDSYLTEMKSLDRPDLIRRVQGLRFSVERWVRQAYRRYIPNLVRR